MNFIAIDFETANSHRSSICSIGLAIVENGKLLRTEHIYVKPTPNYYDGFNTHLHGIADRHTRDQKNFKEHWDYLQPLLHNKTLIAHNASFDCSVLRFTLDSYKIPYPELDYHCTLRLAQESLVLSNHKLNEVSNHFNIRLEHHNAESDARASALIALKLCEKFNMPSLEALSKSLGFSIGKINSVSKTYKSFSKSKVVKRGI